MNKQPLKNYFIFAREDVIKTFDEIGVNGLLANADGFEVRMFRDNQMMAAMCVTQRWAAFRAVSKSEFEILK